MPDKRPLSSSSLGEEHTPMKKGNAHPLGTPKSTSTQIPLDTLSTVVRFGFSAEDASSLVARIDSFTTLVKCIPKIIEQCGVNLEEEKQLGAYIMDAVNAGENKSRSLSTLKESHYDDMNACGVFVDAGNIKWDKDRLPNIYTKDFENWLSLFLRTSARTSEAGCRIIINAYVSYAIDQARRHSELDFIAVFPKVKVDHPGIPPFGKVSGIIDYLVAKTDERDPYDDGDIISAVDPALAIIEVKKSDNIVQKSSIAQLLAQMFCIKHQEFQKRNLQSSPIGILTDGSCWRFFYLKPYEQTAVKANDKLWPEGGELFLSQKLDTKTEEEKQEVLGLLMLFVSGMKPVDAVHRSDGGSSPIVLLQRKSRR